MILSKLSRSAGKRPGPELSRLRVAIYIFLPKGSFSYYMIVTTTSSSQNAFSLPLQATDLEPLAISAAEAATILGISRPKVYTLMHRDDFPSFQIGRRKLISVEGLKKWIADQTTITGGAFHV